MTRKLCNSKITCITFALAFSINVFAYPDGSQSGGGGHPSGQGAGNQGNNHGNAGNSTNNNAITITISFESQIICTDEFFSVQLNQAIFEKFSKCTTIKWVFEPCEESHLCDGKLKCPGDNENLCKLDRIQACVAELYKNDQVKNGLFVTCMMYARDPMNCAPTCCQTAGVDWNKINQCVTSGQGDQYCDAFHKKIMARKPKWVPSIMFDGKYDEDTDTQAKQAFSNTICNKLKQKNLQCDACSSGNHCK